MQNYSDSQALSSKEVRNFTFAAVFAGMLTGILFYDSPAAGVIMTFVFIGFFPLYKRSILEKQRSMRLVQFRDLLYSISSSVSAGRSMAQALEESVIFWQSTYETDDYIMKELRYMNAQIKEGNLRDVTVLREFAERSGLEDAVDFVTVYESCRVTGGDLPKAINRATVIIGDKITLERELKTLMAQKAFESRIVMAAPVIILLILRIISPEYMQPMTESSSGRLIMTFALGLMAAAAVMMERINNIEI